MAGLSLVVRPANTLTVVNAAGCPALEVAELRQKPSSDQAKPCRRDPQVTVASPPSSPGGAQMGVGL